MVEVTGILNRNANTKMAIAFFTEEAIRECICASLTAPTTVTMRDAGYVDLNVITG